MKTFKITFDNGDSLVTRLNGGLQDAMDYYLGHIFNIGTVSDDMRRCVGVEEVEA